MLGGREVGKTAFLNSGRKIFPKGPDSGITLRHPLLTDHPENFSEGAYRRARAEKTQFRSKFSRVFKSAVFGLIFESSENQIGRPEIMVRKNSAHTNDLA